MLLCYRDTRRITVKMKALQDGADSVSPRQLKIAMNKWDRENIEPKISGGELQSI